MTAVKWTFCAALFLASAAAASYSPLRAWMIGDEREVDEGMYFTLVASENGWRLWRIETEKTVECRAIKSARGKSHPVPIGVGGSFFQDRAYTPFVMLSRDYYGKAAYSWKGLDFQNRRVEIRGLGERFWREDKRDQFYRDGDVVEVNIGSWEYPEVSVGWHESRGVVDLTGWDSMMSKVLGCFGRKNGQG